MSSTGPTAQPELQLAGTAPEEVLQIRRLLRAAGLNKASVAVIESALQLFLCLCYEVPASEAGPEVVVARDGAFCSFVQQLTEAPLSSEFITPCVLFADSGGRRMDDGGRKASEGRRNGLATDPAGSGAAYDAAMARVQESIRKLEAM